VNSYNPRLTNDPFSSTYNLGWKNHPNFSYRSNALLAPQTNLDHPLDFKDLPIVKSTSKIQLRDYDGEYAFGTIEAR